MKKSTKSTTLTKKSAQEHLHTRPNGLLETEAPPQTRGQSWDNGSLSLASETEALSQTGLEDLLPTPLADARAPEKRERARIVKTLSALRGGRS